jgi:two-component system NarL family response regulator
MDLRMPRIRGVEAIITICAEFNTARIIVLTGIVNLTER